MAHQVAEPLIGEAPSRTPCTGKVVALLSLLMVLVGAVVVCTHGASGQQWAAPEPAVSMAAWQPLKARAASALANAETSAAAALRRPLAVAPRTYASAVHFAARDGARAGCRGDLACARAVGLFFGTQSGKTEEVATMIGTEAGGLEAKDIGDVSAADLAGYDGLIVGTPTWNTGADEQRSGTTWDDYLDEIKALDMCGKPVAVFGTGDSVGYGDNFCDAIEEIHSTFKAAGAKMVGYVDSSGYEHSESKSDSDGKFLGLPLDQDNEDDKSEDRVKAWVAQLKSEGMPLS